jgi:hypothetical protein
MNRVWIEFVETDLFSARMKRLGLEDSLRGLQLELVRNPERGDTDAGTGGLRKTRLPDSGRGKGKRGGARVHYLWLPRRDRIYLMFVYGKGEQDSLTAGQKRVLREVVERIKNEAR